MHFSTLLNNEVILIAGYNSAQRICSKRQNNQIKSFNLNVIRMHFYLLSKFKDHIFLFVYISYKNYFSLRIRTVFTRSATFSASAIKRAIAFNYNLTFRSLKSAQSHDASLIHPEVRNLMHIILPSNWPYIETNVELQCIAK